MNASAVAQSLLAATVAALGSSAPDRQVLTTGAPRDPLQGEQVAVGWVRNFVGVPGRPDGSVEGQLHGVLVAEFVVRVTRCVATSTTQADTPPANLSSVAVELMDDAETVRAALAGWRPLDVDAERDVWVGNPQGFQPQGFGAGFVIGVHAAT